MSITTPERATVRVARVGSHGRDAIATRSGVAIEQACFQRAGGDVDAISAAPLGEAKVETIISQREPFAYDGHLAALSSPAVLIG